MKLAKYVMKKHKRMCSFLEQLSEKSSKFPRKTSPEIPFLNKVAGYLTLTGNVLSSGKFMKFSEQVSQEMRMPPSAFSCGWKMFRPKDIF